MMQINDNLYSFIQSHIDSDLTKLLLSHNRYPNIDVRFAVEQIAARQRIRDKLPLWYENSRLLFPSKLAAEQASSEHTAKYKLHLVDKEQRLCDLTGGLGVDSYYFSQKIRQVVYVERSKLCFDIAMHNFSELMKNNIEGINEDATLVINKIKDVDVFYLDPARRGKENARVYALNDCEPDVTKLIPILFQKARRIILKLSPMIDIRHTLSLLPFVKSIHIVSVKNECKELLFELDNHLSQEDLNIYCINIVSEEKKQVFHFTLNDEESAINQISNTIQFYLYEPNASVMKAGAYKTIAFKYELNKIHINSHLYTSDQLHHSFPGRIFEVEEVLLFNKANMKMLSQKIPKANVSVRNFPLSVVDLRKRLKILDGGDSYIFATTIAPDQKILISCKKVFT